MTAVSSSMIHMQADSRVKIQDQSDDEIFDDCQNSNSRDASNSSPTYPQENDLDSSRNDLETSSNEHHRTDLPNYSDFKGSRLCIAETSDQEPIKCLDSHLDQTMQLHTSSFSMQNVLKVKTERESYSPESNNAFSTEKLLQNTPDYTHKTSDLREMSPNFRSDSNSAPTPSPRLDSSDTDRYSNPRSVRIDINVDEESCCSEDTVLSVGNEAPVYSSVEEKAPTSNLGVHPPQGLTSFKHIQTHLNAISQLSQNLNLNQPLLLRPNPITPNPLLFLNQSHLLFQNPLINQMEKQISRPQTNLIQNQLQTSPIQPFGLNQFARQLKPNGMQSSSQRPTDENRRIFNARSPESDDERRELILNQNCLKFSIDNILKADFGRRITDPLNRRKSRPSTKAQSLDSAKIAPTKEVFASKTVQKASEPRVPLDVRPSESRVSDEKPTEKTGAIDLSKSDEGASSTPSVGSGSGDGPMVWPAWVYCTRYSDRPSSGRSKYATSLTPQQRSPRTRRPKKPPGERSPAADEKRPRTAFSGPQLARLKHEFAENRYLTERRRQQLAGELGLAEAQIKIWFQNKRAKIKKASGQRNPLALQLMAQGLYNHSTVPLTREEEELQELQARENKEHR